MSLGRSIIAVSLLLAAALACAAETTPDPELREVLREAGYADTDLEALMASGGVTVA